MSGVQGPTVRARSTQFAGSPANIEAASVKAAGLLDNMPQFKAMIRQDAQQSP
jgi:hypothetical protein